ncbi:MAG: Uma2 family endonuclease, partial [Oscillatoriales cyanobacterium]
QRRLQELKQAAMERLDFQEERQRVEKLAAKLRELGVDPDTV